MARLADLKCSTVKFQKGDRILVKSNQILDMGARKRIHKAISNWSGGEVPVFVADPRIEIEIIEAFKNGLDI